MLSPQSTVVTIYILLALHDLTIHMYWWRRGVFCETGTEMFNFIKGEFKALEVQDVFHDPTACAAKCHRP